jgi:hypothetical protein
MRCGDLFVNEQSLRSHTRAELPCAVRNFHSDGLSQTQIDALSRRADHRLGRAEQWLATWDIVFPEVPRPSSPYMDAELSEDLS